MRFNKILAIMLCILLLPTFALAKEQTLKYKINFELNDKAFTDVKNIGDWKIFAEKYSLVGHCHFKDLFTKNSILKSNLSINLNNKHLLALEKLGSQQYYYLRSKDIPILNMPANGYNYYEFMLKGYFFLGLPTNNIALLSYPYGAYSAVLPFYKLLSESFSTNTSKSFSYDNLVEFANKISTVLDDEYVSAQFFRTLLIESGLSEAFYYDLMVFPDYLQSIAKNQELVVTVNGSKKQYKLGDIEVFTSDINSDKFQFKLYLPTNTSGYEIVLNFDYSPADTAYSLNASADVLMEGSEYLSYKLNANGLPGEDIQAAKGEAVFSVSGASLQNAYTHKLRYSWSLNEADKGEKVLNAIIGYVNPSTNIVGVTSNVNASLGDFLGERFPIEPPYTEEDFFSLNDESLSQYKDMLKPYIKRLLVPIIIETPLSVISDIWKYASSSGLISTIVTE